MRRRADRQLSDHTGPDTWRRYHAFIRRLVPALYQQASAGRFWIVLALCSPSVYTHTPGDSALGGTRHTRRAYKLWWQRIFLLHSTIELRVHSIAVTGPPWNTIIHTTWTDHITARDGATFDSHGTHEAHLRWGRITDLVYDWDQHLVDHACRYHSQLGIPVADAAPICD